MTYAIGKSYAFAASHQLAGLAEDHQCSRLHGHNYTVWVELASTELTSIGMVYDFGDMAPLRDHIAEKFDHRHLNDVMDQNPTAEALAAHLYGVAVELLGDRVAAVTVWETATCWASYRPN